MSSSDVRRYSSEVDVFVATCTCLWCNERLSSRSRASVGGARPARSGYGLQDCLAVPTTAVWQDATPLRLYTDRAEARHLWY